jgi:hypothetical protein
MSSCFGVVALSLRRLPRLFARRRDQRRNESTAGHVHERDMTAEPRQIFREPLLGSGPPPPRFAAYHHQSWRLE